MTVGELIQRVQSLYSKGVQSDDTRLSPRHIYNKLLTARSKLIWDKTEYNENKVRKNSFDKNLYQTLNCIELIKIPNHECSCLESYGCNIYRSKYKLPKFMNVGSNKNIKYVGTIDNVSRYKEVPPEMVKYFSGNKYSKNVKYYHIEDQYLYITEKYAPIVMKVVAIFEDPVEVLSFPQYCDSKKEDNFDECKSAFDIEFPIDSDLIEPLIQSAINELVITFNQAQEDISNDSKDSSIQQTK